MVELQALLQGGRLGAHPDQAGDHLVEAPGTGIPSFCWAEAPRVQGLKVH